MTKKPNKFAQEFKTFLMRGNVLDMAVGIIIGAAFTKIVNSLVESILTPVISLVTGKINISELSVTLTPDLTINYGLFIQSVIDFVIIGLIVFLMIKAINVLRRKKEEEPKPDPKPEPSREEVLLTEIRDILKQNARRNSDESSSV